MNTSTFQAFESDAVERLQDLIPKPVKVNSAKGMFSFTADTKIFIEVDNKELFFIGEYLAERLRPSTGFDFPVLAGKGDTEKGNIHLTLSDSDAALGDEGYWLLVEPEWVTLKAANPAGVFWGVQTIRQLLPAEVERSELQPGPWQLKACEIWDFPRFSWRGVMLDVARHFFSVEEVKRLIDVLSYYKINRFHIHLTDDQGWRLMIDTWRNLAEYGGSTQVGGGKGGYYTKAEYSEIVAFAHDRYISVIPEVDMPGHTNAALASYPELNCDGVAPALYTGTEVGFSSLCVSKEVTFTFLEDVIREIAELTPGVYLHIGGDEAAATSPEDYRTLMERVQAIVEMNGKASIGWEEIGQVDLLPSTIVQYWNSGMARKAVEQGNRVIMSPAKRVYLDMKYTSDTPYGLTWAGTVEVSESYNWDPATELQGVTEEHILGVEAPLWTETLETLESIELMMFPRLLGVAEIAWSPLEGRNWDEYKNRLGAHAPRLAALGINYYPSPEVPWK